MVLTTFRRNQRSRYHYSTRQQSPTRAVTMEKIDMHTSPPFLRLRFSKHHIKFRASLPSTARPCTYFLGLKHQRQRPFPSFYAVQASMARLNSRYPCKLLIHQVKQSISSLRKKLYLSSNKVAAGLPQLAVRTVNSLKRASKGDLATWLNEKQYAWVYNSRLVGSGAHLSLPRRHLGRTQMAKRWLKTGSTSRMNSRQCQ